MYSWSSGNLLLEARIDAQLAREEQHHRGDQREQRQHEHAVAENEALEHPADGGAWLLLNRSLRLIRLRLRLDRSETPFSPIDECTHRDRAPGPRTARRRPRWVLEPRNCIVVVAASDSTDAVGTDQHGGTVGADRSAAHQAEFGAGVAALLQVVPRSVDSGERCRAGRSTTTVIARRVPTTPNIEPS
jgi:hypothetical protein